MGGRYRRRPVDVVAITASEIRHASHRDRPRWVQEAITTQRIVLRSAAMTVRTTAGDVTVRPDHWIVREPTGELSVCRPEAFAAAYEPAA
jgi:hypothetical protein